MPDLADAAQLMCGLGADLGFKTREGALIETDQTVAWTIQIDDQADHNSGGYGARIRLNQKRDVIICEVTFPV